MSKTRLVITAVVIQNRPVAQVAAEYGVSRSWLYELLARYRAEGEAAFEPRSRRPRRTPNRTPAEVIELIVALREKLTATGLDSGPDTIGWHLAHQNWLRAQQPQPTTTAELQALIDRFVDEYNHRRPHRSLEHRATPAAVYSNRPKVTPHKGSLTDSTHDRVRRDRVDVSGKITLRYGGRLYSIGIGRTHARTRVLVLVQDLNIRVVAAATGELLRELVLDPTKRYQQIPKKDPSR